MRDSNDSSITTPQNQSNQQYFPAQPGARGNSNPHRNKSSSSVLPQLPGAAVNNETGMSKSTASGSYQQPDPDADLYEPSAGIELDQEELEEIY